MRTGYRFGGRRTENQPTGHGPKGWLGKGLSASLFVRSFPPHFQAGRETTEQQGYKMVRDGHSLPQGRAGLSPEAGKAMAGRSPGGRPLRRRSEMRSVYGRQRLRGTAALQAPSDSRCRHRKLTRKQLFSRRECTEEPRPPSLRYGAPHLVVGDAKKPAAT